MQNMLYADGGVIYDNPSPYGGMWAYRLVKNNILVQKGSGLIVKAEMNFYRDGQLQGVTNNQTELLAVLKGLEILPDDWVGCICSDSQVTIRRLFHEAPWNGIPLWMHQLYRQQRARLKCFMEYEYIILDGHPTREQLRTGIGKRGHPVSVHNKECDRACTELAKAYLQKVSV